LPLSVTNAFNQLEKLLPLGINTMDDIFKHCDSNYYFHNNRYEFCYIARLYKHPSKPHKFIPCYHIDCEHKISINNCVLHNHDGLITYFGHSIPFESFISGFKTEINKWRKKALTF
jgi:hypothetical protein